MLQKNAYTYKFATTQKAADFLKFATTKTPAFSAQFPFWNNEINYYTVVVTGSNSRSYDTRLLKVLDQTAEKLGGYRKE